MTSNNKVISINLTPVLPSFTSCLALQLYTISCILIILQLLFSCHLGLNVINVFCNIYISRTILLKLSLLIYCLAITACLIIPIINYCSRDNVWLFLCCVFLNGFGLALYFKFARCNLLNAILFSSLSDFEINYNFPLPHS